MGVSTQVLTDQVVNHEFAAARPGPDNGLAALVYHISALTHSEIPIDELVERAGSLVLYTLHAESIRIVLRDERTGSVATFADSRSRVGGTAGSFVFSRPVAIRGVQYGRLEVATSDARWPAAALLHLTETIAELLGRRAELEELQAETSILRQQTEDLRRRRELDVLLNRAGGIVAAERDWPEAKAREWIRQEALRKGQPLPRFTERLILAQTLSRRITRARPGLPLAKTA